MDIAMYTVHSLELMNWLCHRGFTVLKVLDGHKNPQYKVFLFQDSNDIKQAVTEYLQNKK